MNDNSIQYEFMKVRYTGDMAKNAVALADMGMGYVVLEKGTDRGEKYAVVAYKHVIDGPIPSHVESLLPNEYDKVSRIFDARISSTS